MSDCARDIQVSVFGILQDFFALWRLVVMRCMLSSRSPAYLNGTRCRTQNRFSQPSEPLGSFREHTPGPASCDRVATLQFLMERGRVRAEKRVGATSTKRKVVAALLNSPTAKRKKSFSILMDSKSPKDRVIRETFGNLSDTCCGVSMNP